MKVSNATLESILAPNNSHGIFDKLNDKTTELITSLAEDLKEARSVKRTVVRFPMLVISGPVDKATKVESSAALRNLVRERAAVLEVILADLAKEVGTEPFPVLLVPEQALWILQMTDKRRAGASQKTYPVCSAKTKAELVAFVEREACEPYVDGGLGKVFKKGGPLEWFYAPESDDSYIDVIGNTTQYVAAARQSIPDVGTL